MRAIADAPTRANRELAAREQRVGIAFAERRQACELAGELRIDLAKLDLGVDFMRAHLNGLPLPFYR